MPPTSPPSPPDSADGHESRRELVLSGQVPSDRALSGQVRADTRESGLAVADGQPTVLSAPGSLPRSPRHSAVFVANLMGLFFGNEAKTRMLAEQVGEVDSYGGRLLPIVDLLFRGPERNLLVLEREADPALTRYLGEDIGLSLPETMVLPHSEYLRIGRALSAGAPLRHEAIDRIAAHPSGWMDGYVTDETLAALAAATGKRTLATPGGSHRGNNKLLLHRHIEAAGLPVVATELAASPAEVPGCLLRLRELGFTAAVVKAPIGASGIGLIKVDNLADRSLGMRGSALDPVIPEHFFLDGPCLVQGWLTPGERGITRIRSPSVQMYLDPTTVTLYDLTEQILSRSSVHEGNESPPPWLGRHSWVGDELLRQAEVASRWLHSQGYRGTASVDFLVAEGEGERENGATVYICEINARVTGATYPSLLAHHLVPGGAWLMRNLRFREPLEGQAILDRLARAGDLFETGKSGAGVLPVNFNFGEDGRIHKGQFLCLAPTTRGSEFLLSMAEADLPCVSDRD